MAKWPFEAGRGRKQNIEGNSSSPQSRTMNYRALCFVDMPFGQKPDLKSGTVVDASANRPLCTYQRTVYRRYNDAHGTEFNAQ
jgi:hypothetical protein